LGAAFLPEPLQIFAADDRGNVTGLLAFLTDDAVMDGLGLCAQSPCVGKDAIRKEFERRVAARPRTTRIDAQTSGTPLLLGLSIKTTPLGQSA